MIKILVINNNRIIIEVSKTTKIEKKVYSRKDRYTFTKPNNRPKKQNMCIPRKRYKIGDKK